MIVFHGNVSKDFAGFLLYIVVVWLGPWFGILMTDWLLRGRPDAALPPRLLNSWRYWPSLDRSSRRVMVTRGVVGSLGECAS